jgi:mannan endo-1,4-beta-mannosidase
MTRPSGAPSHRSHRRGLTTPSWTRRQFIRIAQRAHVLARADPLIALAATVATVAAVVGGAFAGALAFWPRSPGSPTGVREPGIPSLGAIHVTLPSRPESWLGIYTPHVPESYTSIEKFAAEAGHEPNLALYYSGWYQPFNTAFADEAAAHGAVPAIQLDPRGVSIAAIAAGRYDSYLTSYADAVNEYGHQTGKGVVISFGHEMNGFWYPWGWTHTRPAVFVAAWRHIVDVFRRQGTDNVTWLWTVNIIRIGGGIPSPAPWWPGSSYVTWVGIDGYFLGSSWTFAPLFGPTIKAIRSLTLDPILIAETGAAPAVGQPAKITDLFAGVHGYGLLGFVWFDARGLRDFRIISPAALAAYSRGAEAYKRLGS